MIPEDMGPDFPNYPVRIRVLGRTLEIPALLDTGFEGDALVPATLGRGHRQDRYQPLEQAGGSVEVGRVFSGTVQMGELSPIDAQVIAYGNHYVIGTGILRRYEVILDHGQRVIINP